MVVATGATEAEAIANAATAGYTTVGVTNWGMATYSDILNNSGSGTAGRFYAADIDAEGGDIWGPSGANETGSVELDAFVDADIRRYFNHGTIL